MLWLVYFNINEEKKVEIHKKIKTKKLKKETKKLRKLNKIYKST